MVFPRTTSLSCDDEDGDGYGDGVGDGSSPEAHIPLSWALSEDGRAAVAAAAAAVADPEPARVASALTAVFSAAAAGLPSRETSAPAAATPATTLSAAARVLNQPLAGALERAASGEIGGRGTRPAAGCGDWAAMMAAAATVPSRARAGRSPSPAASAPRANGVSQSMGLDGNLAMVPAGFPAPAAPLAAGPLTTSGTPTSGRPRVSGTGKVKAAKGAAAAAAAAPRTSAAQAREPNRTAGVAPRVMNGAGTSPAAVMMAISREAIERLHVPGSGFPAAASTAAAAAAAAGNSVREANGCSGAAEPPQSEAGASCRTGPAGRAPAGHPSVSGLGPVGLGTTLALSREVRDPNSAAGNLTGYVRILLC